MARWLLGLALSSGFTRMARSYLLVSARVLS